MTTLAVDDVVAVTDSVTAMGESVFADLETLRSATLDALSRTRRRTSLAPLQPLCARVLARPDRLLVGAGFVSAPEVLEDAPYWLEWWTAPGAGAPPSEPARLDVVVDPAEDGFRDYTRLPWFAIPRDTRHRHMTGPYVDYLCTDEYTLTFTVPVLLNGDFLGVVGADVYVRHVEIHTLPQLDDLPARAALVNAAGRVVVANDAGLDTGALVRDVPFGELWSAGEPVARQGDTSLYRCGDLPLGLLVAG